MMPEPVDFLTVPLANGGSHVRLDRLTDGRIMCQLCFGYFHRDQLNPVDGGVEDVCKPCAVKEREAILRMTVYATSGGRRFHRYNYCPALHNGRTLWTFNPREWVPGMPQAMLTNGHPLRESTFIAALGDGKTPCHACMPGSDARLARSSSEDDFGHWPTRGISLGYLADTVCQRCTESGVWYGDADDLRPVHIAWPCTSAIVLGLAPRTEAAA